MKTLTAAQDAQPVNRHPWKPQLGHDRVSLPLPRFTSQAAQPLLGWTLRTLRLSSPFSQPQLSSESPLNTWPLADYQMHLELPAIGGSDSNQFCLKTPQSMGARQWTLPQVPCVALIPRPLLRNEGPGQNVDSPLFSSPPPHSKRKGSCPRQGARRQGSDQLKVYTKCLGGRTTCDLRCFASPIIPTKFNCALGIHLKNTKSKIIRMSR